MTDHPDASWPQGSTKDTQICIQIKTRIYYVTTSSTEDTAMWMEGE